MSVERQGVLRIFPEEQPQNVLTITQEELEKLIHGRYSPESLVTLLEKDFADVFAQDAGVIERYTLKQHILMVLSQFERYFGHRPLPAYIDRGFFRLLLALHDIGKPQAIRMGGKHLQHTYTHPIVGRVFRHFGFTEQDTAFACSLVSGDIMGRYIRFGNVEKTARIITALAQNTGRTPLQLFHALCMLHQVDAGSYTADAGGYRSLDFLFVFDNENRIMQYSPLVKARVELLETVLSQRVFLK